MKIEPNHLYLGDCLDFMPHIEDASIDMILCDLPYGTTACRWDMIIPLEPLWKQYKRIIKDNGAIVLTASQPFTTILISSNLEMFKYEWVWCKTRATGHVHAKNKPMKLHENIVIFSKGTTVHATQSKTRMQYHPQDLVLLNKKSFRPSRGKKNYGIVGKRPSHKQTLFQEYGNYPTTLLKIKSEHNVGALHPTQKPVALFEYLIKTYTNEGDLVLDNCIGSGTTAIAALNTNRRYIGIEKEQEYYDKALYRINHRQTKLT